MISTPAQYRESARKNLENDEEVEWDEVDKIEVMVNRHVGQIAKAMNIGYN